MQAAFSDADVPFKLPQVNALPPNELCILHEKVKSKLCVLWRWPGADYASGHVWFPRHPSLSAALHSCCSVALLAPGRGSCIYREQNCRARDPRQRLSLLVPLGLCDKAHKVLSLTVCSQEGAADLLRIVLSYIWDVEISQRNLNDCNSRQWELQICISILAIFGVMKDVTFGFSLFSFFRKAIFWLQDRWIHWRARQVWSEQLMPVNKMCALGLAKTCPVLLKNLTMYLPVSLSKMYGEIFSEVFFFLTSSIAATSMDRIYLLQADVSVPCCPFSCLVLIFNF